MRLVVKDTDRISGKRVFQCTGGSASPVHETDSMEGNSFAGALGRRIVAHHSNKKEQESRILHQRDSSSSRIEAVWTPARADRVYRP